MKFIIAEKKEMTQKYSEDGMVIPVTKLSVQPCVVTQLKTHNKDGYVAVQLGCGKKSKISKPLKGHLKDLGNFRYLKEFRVDGSQTVALKVGNKLTVSIFAPGDIIQVTGNSKGRGFQGVVKRHGFHGSPASHGHKDQLRMPGSAGATGPAHVFKGKKMPGQMGNVQVTVKNLAVIEVDTKNQELFVKGAVPGPRGNLILISGDGELKFEPEQTQVATVAELSKLKPAVEPAAEKDSNPEVKSESEVKAATPVEEVEVESKPVVNQEIEKKTN